MATKKLNVVGELEVGGIAPGGVVELDEDVYNIDALISSGFVTEHVEETSELSPAEETSTEEGFRSFKSNSRKKGD